MLEDARKPSTLQELTSVFDDPPADLSRSTFTLSNLQGFHPEFPTL